MKRLVLVGGGHAHVHVLAALAADPLVNTQVLPVRPIEGLVAAWPALLERARQRVVAVLQDQVQLEDGSQSASGAWAWRWIDRIDRQFMAQFGA